MTQSLKNTLLSVLTFACGTYLHFFFFTRSKLEQIPCWSALALIGLGASAQFLPVFLTTSQAVSGGGGLEAGGKL